jgi:hypothetical protein
VSVRVPQWQDVSLPVKCYFGFADGECVGTAANLATGAASASKTEPETQQKQCFPVYPLVSWWLNKTFQGSDPFRASQLSEAKH